jgi:hypothetical protein
VGGKLKNLSRWQAEGDEKFGKNEEMRVGADCVKRRRKMLSFMKKT